MKLFFFALLGFLLSIPALAQDQSEENQSAAAPTTVSKSKGDTYSSGNHFSQTFFIQGGSFHASSVKVGNGDYTFQYPDSALSSWMVQTGWSVRLFNLYGAGSIGLREGLGYTGFSGSINSSASGTQQTENQRLNVITFDSRLVYLADWFPWGYLIPFVDGGYMLGLYSQAAGSDLESAQGGVGNFDFGAGFRFWINRQHFLSGEDFESRFKHIPVYLTFRYDHILPSNQGVDLASDSYFGGLEIGL